MNGEENMNSAEKAAKAREAKENAKRAKHQARRGKVNEFFCAVGHGIKQLGQNIGYLLDGLWEILSNPYVFSILFLLVSIGVFTLEVVGAVNRFVWAVRMQQSHFISPLLSLS